MRTHRTTAGHGVQLFLAALQWPYSHHCRRSLRAARFFIPRYCRDHHSPWKRTMPCSICGYTHARTNVQLTARAIIGERSGAVHSIAADLHRHRHPGECGRKVGCCPVDKLFGGLVTQRLFDWLFDWLVGGHVLACRCTRPSCLRRCCPLCGP